MELNDLFTVDIPDDPEMAFLVIETQCRTELNTSLSRLREEDSPIEYYYVYMNKVLGAKDELGLDLLSTYELPDLHYQDFGREFQIFQGQVDRFKTRVQIRNLRRNKACSVRFDAATKQKVRHLLNQIKEIVDQVELDDRKKESLYSKINALANEVDRDRTRFEAFGALVIEMAGVVGVAAEKLEPARKWLDSIAKCFGVAKSHEDANPQLPPHRESKKIEAPRKRLPAPRPDDDEIPF